MVSNDDKLKFAVQQRNFETRLSQMTCVFYGTAKLIIVETFMKTFYCCEKALSSCCVDALVGMFVCTKIVKLLRRLHRKKVGNLMERFFDEDKRFLILLSLMVSMYNCTRNKTHS